MEILFGQYVLFHKLDVVLFVTDCSFKNSFLRGNQSPYNRYSFLWIFLIITAFNYTNYTSIALLDSFTIPSAMLLSSIFLKCKYNYWHYVGTMACLCGLICVVISDFLVKSQNSDSFRLFVQNYQVVIQTCRNSWNGGSKCQKRSLSRLFVQNYQNMNDELCIDLW